jgi:hypothetical protein
MGLRLTGSLSIVRLAILAIVARTMSIGDGGRKAERYPAMFASSGTNSAASTVPTPDATS